MSAAAMPAETGKLRVRVKAGSRHVPTIRHRVYDGRRIRATAVGIGYAFCLWTGGKIVFSAGVVVSDTVTRFHGVLMEAIERTATDENKPASPHQGERKAPLN